MTFAEWWKSVEGWTTEGGAGEHKARAAWDHQQATINALLAVLEAIAEDARKVEYYRNKRVQQWANTASNAVVKAKGGA